MRALDAGVEELAGVARGQRCRRLVKNVRAALEAVGLHIHLVRGNRRRVDHLIVRALAQDFAIKMVREFVGRLGAGLCAAAGRCRLLRCMTRASASMCCCSTRMRSASAG